MSTFIIPCKYSKEVPIIFNCLKSIRKFHPNDEIFIVDSDSDDKSYFDRARSEFGAKIEDVGNCNYTSGAIWHVFNNYKRDFYYIFHDSIQVIGNLSFLQNKDLSPVMYHKHWQWPIDPSIEDRSFEWSQKQIEEKTSFKFKSEGFFVLQGAMICCKRRVLEELENKGFNKVLPSNKFQEENTERLWGFALGELGYNKDIQDNSILGLCRQGNGIGSELIAKLANGKPEMIYDGVRYFSTSDGRYHIGKTDKCRLDGIDFIVKRNKYKPGDKVVKYWCSAKRS